MLTDIDNYFLIGRKVRNGTCPFEALAGIFISKFGSVVPLVEYAAKCHGHKSRLELIGRMVSPSVHCPADILDGIIKATKSRDLDVANLAFQLFHELQDELLGK